MVAPASVTASVSAIDKDFSRPPKTHGPGHSVMLRQPRRPPTRATTVTPPPPPSHRDPPTKTDKTGRKPPSRGESGQQPRRRTPPPPPAAVTDRTQLQEQTRPLWPGRARRAREAPVAALQSTRRRPSHTQQESLHQPSGADLGCRIRPAQARDGARAGPDPGRTAPPVPP
nr:serine/arginine-rich splicing factor SR45-like [Lolium perenne]